jgi:hypothetical protein
LSPCLGPCELPVGHIALTANDKCLDTSPAQATPPSHGTYFRMVVPPLTRTTFADTNSIIFRVKSREHCRCKRLMRGTLKPVTVGACLHSAFFQVYRRPAFQLQSVHHGPPLTIRACRIRCTNSHQSAALVFMRRPTSIKIRMNSHLHHCWSNA